jgi:hypothetical protein
MAFGIPDVRILTDVAWTSRSHVPAPTLASISGSPTSGFSPILLKYPLCRQALRSRSPWPTMSKICLATVKFAASAPRTASANRGASRSPWPASSQPPPACKNCQLGCPKRTPNRTWMYTVVHRRLSIPRKMIPCGISATNFVLQRGMRISPFPIGAPNQNWPHGYPCPWGLFHDAASALSDPRGHVNCSENVSWRPRRDREILQ